MVPLVHSENEQFASYSRGCSIIRRALQIAVAFALLLAPASYAGLLYGHAEHAESLAPVGSRLQPGEIFESILLQEYAGTDGWRRIPTAFAGVREAYNSRKYLIRVTDLRTGRHRYSKADPTWRKTGIVGYQKDDRGQIWDYPLVRQIQRGESFTYCTYDLVKERELLQMTENTMIERFVVNCITVNKLTKRIKSVDQRDVIETREAGKHGIIHCETSAKVFSAAGSPLVLYESEGEERLLSGFVPVDFANDVDLKKSFENFCARSEDVLAEQSGR